MQTPEECYTLATKVIYKWKSQRFGPLKKVMEKVDEREKYLKYDSFQKWKNK